MASDDRTTKARIRDAAIREVAERPLGSVTVRDIAAAADVSPGSVIHHFGSMDGLREACNEHVAAVIHTYKSKAVRPHGAFDVIADVQGISELPVASYLAKAMLDDSPVVARLIDELTDDAVGYLEEGVEAGTIRPTDDPRGRATVLLLWTLGGLVLHEHARRLLGVDLTDARALASPDAVAYAGPVLDLLSHGLLTETYAAELTEALAAAHAGSPPTIPPEKGHP